MKTIKNIAASPCSKRVFVTFGLISAVLAMAGCAALPEPPPRASVYDFGPGLAPAAVPPGGGAPSAQLAPIALADIVATGTPDGSTALLYRLGYANPQQLRLYAQARWSQPPASLLQQALRERLGQRRVVLSGSAGMALQASQGRMPAVLRVELEEFSQVFATPQASQGLVRARAVLADVGPGGETLVAQRVFSAQRPAATADAAGGAQALAAAAEQVAGEMADWVRQQGR